MDYEQTRSTSKKLIKRELYKFFKKWLKTAKGRT